MKKKKSKNNHDNYKVKKDPINDTNYDDDDNNNNDTNDNVTMEEEIMTSSISKWISSMAVFGDSEIALIGSFGLLILAIAIAIMMESTTSNDDNNNGNTEPSPFLGLLVVPSTLQTILSMAKQYCAKFIENRKLGPMPKIGPPTIYYVPIDDKNTTFTDSSTSSSKSSSSTGKRFLLSNDMKQAFSHDGVIAIRGLLSNELLQQLDDASQQLINNQQIKNSKKPRGPLTGQMQKKKSSSSSSSLGGTQFFTVQHGTVFQEVSDQMNVNITSTKINHSSTLTDKPSTPFVDAALSSAIPQVVAELLNLQPNETLRLMKDIFLAKDEDQYICGWHVDDTGFWPATSNSPGINAWVALDDMPIDDGGGFALAVGSHIADWKDDAYQVTGSTHTYPSDGFHSAADFLQRRVGNGTCNIRTAAPHLHRRMEETKRIYDVQRGDVIFHTRWLFHRTVPFEKPRNDDENDKNDNTEKKTNKSIKKTEGRLYRRYSIRYGPGSSIIFPGFGTEPSVVWDTKHGGRTADEICDVDTAWYPKASFFMSKDDDTSNDNDDENDENDNPNTDNNNEDRQHQLEQMYMIATERLPKLKEVIDVRKRQLRTRRKR